MSKYKQIIKNIYPSTPEGDIQAHNISKLVYFCEISPQKILKVSKYIESKAKKDLSRSRIKLVGVALKIYQELIKGCRKNNLFAENVLAFTKAALENPSPELKIWATETFIKFAEVVDESSQYRGIEGLVPHFFAMSQYNQGDPAIRMRVREQGLKGIRAYIGILDITDELDSFVTRYTDESNNTQRFIPIILENITYMAVPNEQNIVQVTATEVLREVFSRANLSVMLLLRAILGYLDSKNMWVPNTFAMMCFSAIYNNIKPQHAQILMTLLLQHLADRNRPIVIKTQVVTIMAEFFLETTGLFMQILDVFAGLLISSVEALQQNTKDSADHRDLQSVIINHVGILCRKVSAQHTKVLGFEQLCYQLSSRTNSANIHCAAALLQCVLQVVPELQMKGLTWMSPNAIAVLSDLAAFPNDALKAFVQKVCAILQIDPKMLTTASSDIMEQEHSQSTILTPTPVPTSTTQTTTSLAASPELNGNVQRIIMQPRGYMDEAEGSNKKCTIHFADFKGSRLDTPQVNYEPPAHLKTFAQSCAKISQSNALSVQL